MNRMRQLGISIYPENQKMNEMKEYVRQASELKYTRIFSSLLAVTVETKKDVLAKYKEIFMFAKQLGFDICLDVNPEIFDILGIQYDNLKVFNDMNVNILRLDTQIPGETVANMTYNEYGINIEINMSTNNDYINNILSFQPIKDRLIACHNFYPQRNTGLDYDFFIKTSKLVKKHGIRTAAFVSSKDGKVGPWNISEGLPTLELHRNMPITTQVKHLWATGLIDDVLIGNSFASYDELKSLSEINKYKISLNVKVLPKTTKIEKEIIELDKHFRRGDINKYIIRSTMPRVWYKNNDFEPHNVNNKQVKGDIFICNNNFGHYKGELHLILNELPNDNRKNLVAKVIESEIFLINYIDSWSKFELKIEKKTNN